MGQLRFTVAPRLAENDHYWDRLAFLNHEGLPYRARIEREGDCIILNRADSDSGYLIALWKSSQLGEIALTTGTLIERKSPYILSLELARGTLNRLRNQAAIWLHAGVIIPSEYNELASSAMQWFAQATTSRDDLNATIKNANLCLETALQAMLILISSYARQSLAARQRANPKPLMMIGTTLEHSPLSVPMQNAVASLSNSLSIPMTWKEIEKIESQFDWDMTDQAVTWALSKGKRICAGPLLELNNAALPEWTVLWEGDYDNLFSMSGDFVRKVVERYKGRVHIWNAVSKVNTSPSWSLSDEQRLRLTLHIAETIRQLDSKTPIIITLDQPGGEGLVEQGGDLTPIQFIDTLMRSNIPLAGIGLEYNIGIMKGQSLPRDPLYYCQQLDFWALLNLPLILFMQHNFSANESSQNDQKKWLTDYGPVLLSKAVVQGFFWNKLQDRKSRDDDVTKYKHAGLFDENGTPKPVAKIMKDLVEQYGN